MSYANYPSLKDRSVLVTGGGSGIGAGLVSHFAQQGAKVGFIDVDVRASEALVAQLTGPSLHAPMFIRCDVTDTGSLKRVIGELNDAMGPITVLVNNAGNDDRHSFDEVTPEYWDQRMNVLLKHYFFAAQTLFPTMQQSGGGSIINFSSTTWLMGEGGYVCYTTAKAAIYGMTRSLARDFGVADIRVNAVLPGWIMTERQIENWITPQAEAEIERNQAIKHKLYPEDVARMVLFLGADDSRMITGQRFIVDGGWS